MYRYVEHSDEYAQYFMPKGPSEFKEKLQTGLVESVSFKITALLFFYIAFKLVSVYTFGNRVIVYFYVRPPPFTRI